ncbi:MAG: hypothetical protein P4N59_03630 [Negativicutes bacterium]|nr:hypothetical protein [Negativicutes bacterium]
MTDIYVDGSFKEGKYAWGFVAYQDGEEIHAENGVGDNAEAVAMRNVAGELAAAMRAVNWAIKEGVDKIVIHHDYTGIAAWVNGSWKAKKVWTQKYAKFMQSHYLRGFVRFEQIVGHSGNRGNERADELAGSAYGKNAP